MGKDFVWKVRVILNDGDTNFKVPHLLFDVENTAPPSASGTLSNRKRSGHAVESRILEKSKDGKSVVRQHVFRAKL